MSLTVIGSTAIDSIETRSEKRADVLGGSATYASLSASFFSAVNLISVVGEDFPVKYIKIFRKHNINISGLEVKKGRTFRWKARYSPDFSSARTLKTELNVFTGFRPSIPDKLVPAKDLLLANIDPDLQSFIFDRIRPAGITACDTMNLWIKNSRAALLRLMKNIDIFLLNDAEARQISGEKDLSEAAKFIISRGCKAVVIKKGEHGVLLFSGKTRCALPAFLLESIKDPTGAGDSFAGGMIGFLSSRRKLSERVLRRSLAYGTIMASFAVERFSASALAKVSVEKIKQRYESFRELTYF